MIEILLNPSKIAASAEFKVVYIFFGHPVQLDPGSFFY